jgi:hypothetical protein
LVTFRSIYGNASPGRTISYPGIESEEMATGLVTFEQALSAVSQKRRQPGKALIRDKLLTRRVLR